MIMIVQVACLLCASESPCIIYIYVYINIYVYIIIYVHMCNYIILGLSQDKS